MAAPTVGSRCNAMLGNSELALGWLLSLDFYDMGFLCAAAGPSPVRVGSDRHEELRALVARGQGPAKAWQAAVSAQKLAEARRLTFRNFAQCCVDEPLLYRSGG